MIAKLSQIIVVFVLLCSAAAAQDLVFVSQSAQGKNTGTSWKDAFVDLQDALDSVQPGDVIWVAKGTYLPDRGTGDRSLFFPIVPGVALFGGFSGTEVSLSQRDPDQNLTVLSGDLVGNDDAIGGNLSENSLHVLRGDNYGSQEETRVDGFTIQGGNANLESDDRGGGIRNSGLKLIVHRCQFLNNSADHQGGGIYATNGDVEISGCSFTGNFAGHSGGGAIVQFNDNALVRDSQFVSNSVDSQGGGIDVAFNKRAAIRDCLIEGNYAEHKGGGISFVANESVAVERCRFIQNLTENFGGGLSSDFDSSLEIINSSFLENTTNNGGAMRLLSSASIVNCTIANNEAPTAGGVIAYYDLLVANSVLWGNVSNSAGMKGQLDMSILLGGELGFFYSDVQDLDPLFAPFWNVSIDPLFADSMGRLSSGSPCIDAGANGAFSGYLPLDLDGNPRFLDDPLMPDTGRGIGPIIDMGAYEKLP